LPTQAADWRLAGAVVLVIGDVFEPGGGLCWVYARLNHGDVLHEDFNHPVVGELTLAYEELIITADPGFVLMIYNAKPGSPSAERLRLLASWAASRIEALEPQRGLQ
jgi:hypothetical protein